MTSKLNEFRKAMVVVLALICILPTSVSAISFHMNNTSDSSTNNMEITVDIDGAADFTDEKIEKIKNDVLAYHIYGNNLENVSTYGLKCTLFGHDKQTNRVRVVEHKVAKTEPRCKEVIYNVTTCSRCDYEEIERVGYSYIFCCPED